MTSDAFHATVTALQAAGRIRSGRGWKVDLADALGVSPQTIDNFVAHGTRQRQTDLALAAIMADLDPL